jgi:hypothetical protein
MSGRDEMRLEKSAAGSVLAPMSELRMPFSFSPVEKIFGALSENFDRLKSTP